VSMIHNGLFEKYPGLRVAFTEGGCGWTTVLLDRMARNAELGTLVLPAHFAAPTAGHIRRDGLRWRFQFAG